MSKTNVVENEQRRNYPGLTVRRDRDAVVVHVPMRFCRRNGNQMLLTPEGHTSAPDRQVNRPLVQALAKAHRWQEQLESGKYVGMRIWPMPSALTGRASAECCA